ncbi:MAG: dihydrodipicolinate synthase family protein, partial [Armatimonadota bacterium]
ADAALAAIPNFAGIKVSKPDLFEFQELLSGFGDRLDLFWGSDETLLPALSVGAVAAVGSTYNHSAPLYRQLIGAWERGAIAEARELAARSVAMVRALVPGGVLANQKALLAARGLPLGPPRPPLVPAAPGTGERFAARFDAEGWWGDR